MNPLRWIGWRTLVVLLALLGLEGGLRLWSPYGKRTVTLQDAFHGWTMLPSQRGAAQQDLSVPENINRFGYRDREWDEPRRAQDGSWIKDPQVYRVCVLGNSVTFGTLQPIEAVWTRKLEEELAQELRQSGDRRRVEVQNFAVEGYVFEHMARVFSGAPSAAERLRLEAAGLPVPHSRLTPARAWVPDLLIVPLMSYDVAPMPPAVDDPPYRFRDLVLRSATYDLLAQRVINRWIPAPALPQNPQQAELLELDRSLKVTPFAAENRVYWDQAGQRLAQLRELVEAGGGRLVTLEIPTFRKRTFPAKLPNPALFWEPWAREQSAAGGTEVLNVDLFNLFDKRMQAFEAALAERGLVNDHGVQRVDPATPHAQESLYLLADPEHYNAAGHALFAQALARALSRGGALPQH